MLPIKLLILILGYLLSPTIQNEIIPTRDYESKNYFLVELNTTNTQKPLIDFINKYQNHYTFEHQLPSLDNYYVFSIDKNHPHNSFLGNHNSNGYNLMKREVGYEEHYDDLISSVQAIHMLPPKKLSKEYLFLSMKKILKISHQLTKMMISLLVMKITKQRIKPIRN